MRIAYAAPIVLALVLGISTGVNSQGLRDSTIQRIEDCCNVINVDEDRGIVTVIDNDTGESRQFSMSDQARLRTLGVGMAINGNFTCVNPGTPEEDCWNVANRQAAESAGRSAQGMTVDLDPGVTITLQSLKRQGSRAVRLDFSLRNDSGDQVIMTNYGMFSGPHYSLRDVSMIDYNGGLRYGAIVDSEDTCACSRGDAMNVVQDGEAPSLWVQIAAPPQGVEVVSIDFAGAASIDNVSIEP